MSPVGEYAAICPFQAKPQSDIQSTYNQMRRCSLTIAPVVGPDGLLGIVTCCALARALRQNRRARLRLAGTRVG